MIDQQTLHEKRTQTLTQYFQAMDDLRTLKMDFAVCREHAPEEQIAYNNSLNELKRRVQELQFELTQITFQAKSGRLKRRPPQPQSADQHFQDANRKLENLRNRNK